jgi:uncharacterized integral membrane protein
VGMILKALGYGIGAMVIIAFILSNHDVVSVNLLFLKTQAPLYLPVALAFSLGLLIGLLYAFYGAITHRIALRRLKRQQPLPRQ